MKVDVWGKTLDLLTVGEFKDAMDPVGDKLKKMTDLLGRERPTDNDVQASTVTSAAGLGTLDFGAPDASQVWDVRRISVIGQNIDAAAVTCTVRVFKRSAEALTIVDASGVQVPTTATYSRNQLTLKPGENLLVRVAGFTATAGLFGMIQVSQTRWQSLERYSL